MGDLLSEVSDLVDQGALTALPFRSLPASRIDAAFRLMAGGKHTGKVVVEFAEPFIVMSAISRCAPIWHPCRDAMDLRFFPVVSLRSTTGLWLRSLRLQDGSTDVVAASRSNGSFHCPETGQPR